MTPSQIIRNSLVSPVLLNSRLKKLITLLIGPVKYQVKNEALTKEEGCDNMLANSFGVVVHL
jgi:hypothetical protein